MKQLLVVLTMMVGFAFGAEDSPMRILNFQADNGYAHASKKAALAMVEALGETNGWEVVTTTNAASLTELDLKTFQVVVFNNNCGNKGPVMTPPQQKALQAYVRQGGGFLGIHCAGALWKEGGEFQGWYEGLIGTRLVRHPHVQTALLNVEDRTHIATSHLPAEWQVRDEWHTFSSNPRDKVHVLISVDEDSYKGKQKMGGDHPFTWYQEYDGGRSFFTSLGHTKEIYANENFQKLVEGALLWAGGNSLASTTPVPVQVDAALPITEGLFLDLDAANGVELEDQDRVKAWHNQVEGNAADVFVKRDPGRKKGSGRPSFVASEAKLSGLPTLVFKQQELVNMNEDAFDHMIQGSGYTWFSVMCVYKQRKGKTDVNSFFGNLRNGQPYDGSWGCLMDDNRVWMGTRNGMLDARGPLWDEKLNPLVASPNPLEENRYYLIMGRMGEGQSVVNLDLYVNDDEPIDSQSVPVKSDANPSKMAIGQERDATNHPGRESFDGEIARFMMFDRALSDAELSVMSTYLLERYRIDQVQ